MVIVQDVRAQTDPMEWVVTSSKAASVQNDPSQMKMTLRTIMVNHSFVTYTLVSLLTLR